MAWPFIRRPSSKKTSAFDKARGSWVVRQQGVAGIGLRIPRTHMQVPRFSISCTRRELVVQMHAKLNRASC